MIRIDPYQEFFLQLEDAEGDFGSLSIEHVDGQYVLYVNDNWTNTSIRCQISTTCLLNLKSLMVGLDISQEEE